MIESTRRSAHLCAVIVAALVGAACGEDAPATDEALTLPPPGAGADTAARDTAAMDSMQVTVYFTRAERPVPVDRSVPATRAPLTAALGALLEGPTDEERAAGLSSWFSAETAGMVLDASIGADGHAVVDFADFSEAMPNASTSAGSSMLLDELNHTVFQFDMVRSVEYRFEGDCARFFEWLQRSCERVERPA